MTATPPSSRDKILDVGEALFAQRGFSGVGLRELAEASGLSKSSLFHHFSGKTELYFEVLTRVLERFHERLAPVYASADDPAAKLDRALDSLVDGLAEHPTTARLLLRALFEDDVYPSAPGPGSERVEQVLELTLEGIRAVLRDGVASGAFRSLSVPHALQTLIGATVYPFASGEFGESLLGRPVFSAQAVRERKQELHRLVRSGIAAPPDHQNVLQKKNPVRPSQEDPS